MSYVNYVKQKAVEKNTRFCQSCKTLDIFYALGNICFNCQSKLPSNEKMKSLQFSIEILSEFYENYDLYTVKDKNKGIVSQFLKSCTDKIENDGKLENENIIKIQSFVKTLQGIGGSKVGFFIELKNGVPSVQLASDYNERADDPNYRIKSLSALIFSIQYILAFEVDNEFVLDFNFRQTTSNKTAELHSETLNKKAIPKGSGCLISLIFLSLIPVTIYHLYIYMI